MENIALSEGNMLSRTIDELALPTKSTATFLPTWQSRPSRVELRREYSQRPSVADKEYMDPRGITRSVGTTKKRTCQPPTSHPVDRRLRDLCTAFIFLLVCPQVGVRVCFTVENKLN
ncbi:hypothetical protein SDJN03_19069, partial [Cucurbita argyrosperma subsp. sororia]